MLGVPIDVMEKVMSGNSATCRREAGPGVRPAVALRAAKGRVS
jgi:hypothetical protein